MPSSIRGKHELRRPTRRWRDYRTATGRRPIYEFITAQTVEDQAEIAAAMREVREEGLIASRHLRGDIFEVRATGKRQEFRILFAAEGRQSQVLLSLEAFSKKTQKTPPPKIALAQRRLMDWRRRGRLYRHISRMRYHADVARKKDFLDELIDEGARRDPRFPKMVDAAYERRRLLRDLAARRERSGLTQKDVATRMRTSQSAVARIERGEIDAKLSTVERYAAAIGHRLEWRVKRSAS